MTNNKKARGILVLALVFGVTAFGFSFDIKSFPSPIQKGSILISGGFGLGILQPEYFNSSILLGGTVAVDYALPINFALTVGGEAGFYVAKLESTADSPVDVSLAEIPIALRVAWHPNWEIRNLDTYIVVKAGYGIGFWLGDTITEGIKKPHGIIVGSSVGVRYFFTPGFGAFLEGGFEGHYLKFKDEYEWGGTLFSTTHTAYATKFLTLGVTLKAGR
ncbi:MAG: hypothetical protein LBG25_02680 [Spirochaetaceae bacterium]|jgi:hypothetical protein|nr:hypothetical protein [Spirochaetaceae bacterium]